MNINIRHEKEEDYKVVENIARECFWNLYTEGCEEHFILRKMRTHEDFIKELSFVIEVDGEIAGGIFYTKSKIISDREVDTITFGPVFILPKYHRKGLGRKLIIHSIEKAKELSYKAILVLGYPHYYEPYGFLGGKNYNICMPDNKFYKGLLALPLYFDALKNVEGYAQFSDVFEVTKEELDKFDKGFVYKQKFKTKTQIDFEKSVAMLDG